MAWNNNSDPKRDASILQQVAFKGAIEYVVARGLDVTTPEGDAEFGLVFQTFAVHLNDAVKSATGAATSSSSTEDKIKKEFTGTTEANQEGDRVVDGITIKGGSGDVPSWLIDAAKEAGVTSVWDNTAEVGTTKKPHYKAADGTTNAKGYPVGFWPPKE